MTTVTPDRGVTQRPSPPRRGCIMLRGAGLFADVRRRGGVRRAEKAAESGIPLRFFDFFRFLSKKVRFVCVRAPHERAAHKTNTTLRLQQDIRHRAAPSHQLRGAATTLSDSAAGNNTILLFVVCAVRQEKRRENSCNPIKALSLLRQPLSPRACRWCRGATRHVNTRKICGRKSMTI